MGFFILILQEVSNNAQGRRVTDGDSDCCQMERKEKKKELMRKWID